MKTLRAVRRKLETAIAWMPASDSYHVIAGMRLGMSAVPPLYVTQELLRATRSAAELPGSPIAFGVLAGSLCRCPRTDIEYLLLDTVRPASRELTAEDPVGQLATEVRSLMTEIEHSGKLVLGWFIGGMDEDLALDPELQSMQRELFANPWQIVLVLSEQRGVQNGAFVRFDSIADRWYTIPFFELVSPPSGGSASDELASVTHWQPYRTAQAVHEDGTLAGTGVAVEPPPGTLRRDSPSRGWAVALRASWNGRVRREREAGAPAHSRERDAGAPPRSAIEPRSSATDDTPPASIIAVPISDVDAQVRESETRAHPDGEGDDRGNVAADQLERERPATTDASVGEHADLSPAVVSSRAPDGSTLNQTHDVAASASEVAFPALLPETSGGAFGRLSAAKGRILPLVVAALVLIELIWLWTVVY
jgi:hypothetical protein